MRRLHGDRGRSRRSSDRRQRRPRLPRLHVRAWPGHRQPSARSESDAATASQERVGRFRTDLATGGDVGDRRTAESHRRRARTGFGRALHRHLCARAAGEHVGGRFHECARLADVVQLRVDRSTRKVPGAGPAWEVARWRAAFSDRGDLAVHRNEPRTLGARRNPDVEPGVASPSRGETRNQTHRHRPAPQRNGQEGVDPPSARARRRRRRVGRHDPDRSRTGSVRQEFRRSKRPQPRRAARPRRAVHPRVRRRACRHSGGRSDRGDAGIRIVRHRRRECRHRLELLGSRHPQRIPVGVSRDAVRLSSPCRATATRTRGSWCLVDRDARNRCRRCPRGDFRRSCVPAA